MSLFLTEKNVENEYSLSRAWLRKRRLLRLPPAFSRAGRKVLYARSEIEKFLRENAVPTREVRS
jgi:hypothetical protein